MTKRTITKMLAAAAMATVAQAALAQDYNVHHSGDTVIAEVSEQAIMVRTSGDTTIVEIANPKKFIFLPVEKDKPEVRVQVGGAAPRRVAHGAPGPREDRLLHAHAPGPGRQGHAPLHRHRPRRPCAAGPEDGRQVEEAAPRLTLPPARKPFTARPPGPASSAMRASLGGRATLSAARRGPYGRAERPLWRGQTGRSATRWQPGGWPGG